MAMTKAGMASALADAMVAQFGAADDPDKLEAAMAALAEGIVNYILANAVPTGEVVIPSGSSAGTYPLASGKVT